MMNYLLRISIAIIGFASLNVWGADIHTLKQTVLIEADGSAILEMSVSIDSQDSLSSIAIPAGFEDVVIKSVNLDEETELSDVSISLDRGTPVYSLRFVPAVVGEHTITIRSDVADFLDWNSAGPEEFKTYNWEVVYTNTLANEIQNCTLTVLLPAGWNFHRITNSDPKFKKKEPRPPYQFSMIGDRASVTINKQPLEYMGSVAIEFAFKNEQKPNILIWIGLLLCTSYLYYFRHLILRKDVPESSDTKDNLIDKNK